MLGSDPVNMTSDLMEEEDDEVEGNGRKEGDGRNERTDKIETWSMEMDGEKEGSVVGVVYNVSSDLEQWRRCAEMVET